MSEIDSSRQAKLRALPAVEKALADKSLAGVLTEVPRRLAIRTVRAYLDEVRGGLQESADAPGYDPRELERRLLGERRPRLTRAINGLGVVLHTGLGRAPLCDAAQEALADVRLVRIDLHVFRDELAGLKMATDLYPGFFLLGPDMRPRDGIHGGEWDEDIARNIAPVLSAFVKGKYTQRRQDWSATTDSIVL